jgi:hypothetical protein
LRISALPLCIDSCLIPRLERFEKRRPGLRIEIETVTEIVDLNTSDVDACRHTLILLSGRPEAQWNWFRRHDDPSAVYLGGSGVKESLNPVKTKLVSDDAYRSVYREADKTRPLIEAFDHWIVDEIQADKHRLMQLEE